MCNGVLSPQPIVSMNPTSGKEALNFGVSFIAGPQGEILAQASADQEQILMAELNLEHLETVRQNWPFYRDRRIDAYEASPNDPCSPEVEACMPEWEPHEGLLLCYPRNGHDWPVNMVPLSGRLWSSFSRCLPPKRSLFW